MKNKKISVRVCAMATLFAATLWIASIQEPASAEARNSAASLQDTLCIKHRIPENLCFFCDSSLREPGRLWCNEHDRYEDRCFICRPELKEENRLWCKEHKLYEDECFICHPELEDAFAGGERDDAPRAARSESLQCLEHGVLEKDCGICHPELIEKLPVGQGLQIRLKSSESAQKAGIVTAVPSPGAPRARITFFGKTTYDQNRFARITPPAGGIIQKVPVDVGVSVSEGQVLAEISSPEIAQAKSRYVSGLAEEELKKIVFEREERLLRKNISPQQDYEQAQADYRMAQSDKEASLQELLSYGLTEEQLHKLEKTRSRSSLLPIRAPFTGTIVSRSAVIGEVIRPGDTLFDLADLSSMWVELSIPESNLNLVKVNDRVEVTFDVLPELRARGQITWISQDIDERTRMIKGRAVVSNAELLLKQGMFCRIHLLSGEEVRPLFVSVDALHTLSGKPIVFVKLSDDLYEARRIVAGSRAQETLEVLEGLSPHEEVVVNHSFTLKSEFLKSRLGVGCVDE